MSELERIRAAQAECRRWDDEYNVAPVGSFAERAAYDMRTGAEVDLLDFLLLGTLDKLLAVAVATTEYIQGEPSLVRVTQGGILLATCMDCGETAEYEHGGQFPHKPDCVLDRMERAVAALTTELDNGNGEDR